MFFLKIKLIIAILFLLYLAYEDIRYRKISTYMLVAGYVVAVGCLMLVREFAIWEYLVAGCIGVLFLFFSIAGENIGIGDGALIMLLGMLFGARRQILVLFIALLLCAITATVLLLLGKVKKKSRLPFVPFLCVAFFATL